MGILTKKVRTTQPQEVVLAAPLSSSAYGFLLGDSSPELFGSSTVVTYTGTTKSVGLTGVTRNFVGASSHRGTLPTPSYVDATKPWAAVVVFKCNNIGTVQKLAGWTGGTTHVSLNLGATGKLSLVSGVTGTPSARTSSSVLSSGVTYKVCLGYDGTNWFIKINGKDDSGASAGTVGIATAGATTYIGCKENSTAYFTGDITLFAYIQGKVNAQSLSANPWQLFPDQRSLLSYVSVVGGTVNYTLTCAVSSFAITSNNITLRRGHSLTCAASSFTITGNNVTLRRGYSLSSAASAFAITSNNVTLRRGHSLSSAASAFAITSNNVTLTYVAGSSAINYTLTCDASAFAITSTDITLRRGYSLSSTASAFAITSNNVTLRRGYSLSSTASAFAIASNNVTLTYTPGAVTQNYTLICAASAFAITSNNATLTYTSGAPLTISVSDAQAITAAFWANTNVKKWLTFNEFMSHK